MVISDSSSPTGKSRNKRIQTALASLKKYWVAALLFSVAVNLLMLVSPLYMLQIYDRVMTSGSYETLTALTVLAVVLLAIFGAAEGGRRRVFALLGQKIGDKLNTDVFRSGAYAAGGGRQLEKSVSDLAKVQGFFVNGQIQPLFDAPFAPFFLLVTFIIHPLIGLLSTGGAILMLILAIINERTSRESLKGAHAREVASNQFLTGVSNQFSAISSMGMHDRVEAKWKALRDISLDETVAATNRTAFLSSMTKSLRQILQVGVLGLGAFLAMRQQISPGGIIAGSIIMGRALAPIDQAVGMWSNIVRVRQAWADLNLQLDVDPPKDMVTALPRPEAILNVEDMSVAFPGTDKALVPSFMLKMQPGAILLILGQSGGGKTSLLQTMTGAWPPLEGKITLGGRAIHDWDASDRGKYIGYLPQRIELLPGTIRENIARFDEGETDKVFAAAQKAGCHEMILSLPDGYDTPLNTASGRILSAGQMQSIGIARALYDDPVAVFLDEPTANLDPQGVANIVALLRTLKEEGAVTVVATHDFRLINACDNVLTLQDGKVRFNSREECLKLLTENAKAQQAKAQGGTAKKDTGLSVTIDKPKLGSAS